MPTITLSSKIYNNNQLKHVEEHLKSSLKGLKVKIESVQAAPRSWIQVTLSGEDENAALSYLEKTIGLCPTYTSNITRFSITRGYIKSLGKREDQLQLDIGPNIIDATIPLLYLQAQLADGRKIALKKIVELYGFCENMPLTAKITRVNGNCLEAMIAENQLKQYNRWIKSLFDRLIVLGASQQEIRKALKEARCQNDTVGIEQLGLFEHAVVCKFGTNAIGLVPKVGKKLSNATLSVFSPKTILELLPDIAH
ncbi:DUF2110 family protein [Candidatus Bathyarchaeota archaeon]|nr:DUF2110 family protein [Candidatus Bathyarchaeota archaeon]